MINIRIFSALVLAATVAGCGSNGDDKSPAAPITTPPVTGSPSAPSAPVIKPVAAQPDAPTTVVAPTTVAAATTSSTTTTTTSTAPASEAACFACLKAKCGVDIVDIKAKAEAAKVSGDLAAALAAASPLLAPKFAECAQSKCATECK